MGQFDHSNVIRLEGVITRGKGGPGLYDTGQPEPRMVEEGSGAGSVLQLLLWSDDLVLEVQYCWLSGNQVFPHVLAILAF